jgi:hypothetical protein
LEKVQAKKRQKPSLEDEDKLSWLGYDISG